VPDRIGQTVGQRYELLAVVGRGGQGMVYRAFDRWLGRAVAVKVLGSKAAREPHMVERLMREQQAMTVLKGTAAVELLDVCRGSDGELCLVMELLQGVDLDEYLFSIEQRSERLSLLRIAEIFEPIVDTLDTAHAAGILHRDLKPANIFLLEGGDVRLLDFGMARLKNAQPLTAAGTAMGSPSFMAPEAWKGVSDLLDQRVDVYSLGVILFRVLAGQLPFSGDTLKDKFVNATSAARPSLRQFRPDLPRDADEWVKLALAANREERFENVRALWNVFTSVMRVPAARGRKAPSLWSTAKGMFSRARFGAPKEPAPRTSASPPASSDENSFTRDALARSVFHVPHSPDQSEPQPAAERTLELEAHELLPMEPPARKPPPAAPPPTERTLSMSDSELTYDEEANASPRDEKPKSEPR
jgi:serine/threonine-protein kinase